MEMGGVNFDQYQNWEKYTSPSGGTYYVVPGTSYVYDPFASRAKKRPILYQKDPRSYTKKPSVVDQILPQAGSVIGPVLAQQAVQHLTPSTPAEILANAQAQQKLAQIPTAFGGTAPDVVNQSFLNGVNGATPVGTAANGGTMMADGTVAGEGAVPVGTAANGGTLMSDGTIAAPELGITPYLGVAGAGLGAYGVYNATQMKDKTSAGISGALSGAGMGAGIGMAAPLIGLAAGPIGWGALGAMALGGAVLGGGLGAGLAHKTTKEKQEQRWNDVGRPDLAQNFSGVDYFAGTPGEKTRDEKYLTPDAIRVNPENYRVAPDWDKWGKPAQDQFLSAMLSGGHVDEKKGGIYYDDKAAQKIAEQVKNHQIGKALAARINARG